MDPQQELFSKLLIELKKTGYDVYDGALPSDDTPYPFIYLAESQLVDNHTKNSVMATVHQTVNVWHNDFRKRGIVSDMLCRIKQVAYQIDKTQTYSWTLSDVSQQIMTDDTTKSPLMHGVIDFEFRMTGGIK